MKYITTLTYTHIESLTLSSVAALTLMAKYVIFVHFKHHSFSDMFLSSSTAQTPHFLNTVLHMLWISLQNTRMYMYICDNPLSI